MTSPESPEGQIGTDVARPAGFVERIRAENESPRSVGRNVLASYLNVARSALVGLILTPVLVSHLGAEAFGTWTLILGVTSYILLLEAGLGTAVTTRVSALGGGGDAPGVERIVAAGLWIACASALLGTIAMAGLTFAFTDLFDVPSHLAGVARLAFLVAGLAQVFMLFNTVFAAGIIGAGRFDRISILGLLTTVGVTLAQLALVLLGAGIVGIAMAFALGTLVTWFAQMRIFRQVVGPIRLSRRYFDRRTARTLGALGWRNSLVAISGSLAYGSDVVIVGAMVGVKAAGSYAIASRAVSFAQALTTAGGNVLMPTYSNAAATGNRRRMLSMYRLSLLGTLTIAIPAAISLIFFGHSLLHIWLGNVPTGSTVTLALLGALLVVGLPSYCSFLLLMGSEASGYLLRFGLASTVINLGASIAATYAFGTPGPAIGSLLASLLVDPLLVIGVLHRKLDTGLHAFSPVMKILSVPTVVASALATTLAAFGSNEIAIVGAASAVASAGVFFATLGVWASRDGALKPLGIDMRPVAFIRTSLARG